MDAPINFAPVHCILHNDQINHFSKIPLSFSVFSTWENILGPLLFINLKFTYTSDSLIWPCVPICKITKQITKPWTFYLLISYCSLFIPSPSNQPQPLNIPFLFYPPCLCSFFTLGRTNLPNCFQPFTTYCQSKSSPIPSKKFLKHSHLLRVLQTTSTCTNLSPSTV